MSGLNLTLEETPEGAATGKLEIVERKGLGHPDTICDGLAESVSQALTRYYVNRFGMPLHHNVDKVLLVGGEAQPQFGAGKILAPISVTLAGRATASFRGESIPVEKIALTAAYDWLFERFSDFKKGLNVAVQCAIHPGSVELVELFGRGANAVPLANDTSIGVGFYPHSALETMVLELDRELLAEQSIHPEVGLDTKIIGIRFNETCDVTVACAFIGKHLKDLREYDSAKSRLTGRLHEIVRTKFASSKVAVNTADDFSKNSVYLTVTGTSAESGDDGETGRGNRANGLITPCRPMTMEASAGKNCVTHTGKIYQIISSRIARTVVQELPAVTSCVCYLVSQIGKPITEPLSIHLRLQGTGASLNLDPIAESLIHDIVHSGLEKAPDLWREAIAPGGLQVFPTSPGKRTRRIVESV